jgi:endonuclease/exonuclease/phosphatase family metal-dependent hydrolase
LTFVELNCENLFDTKHDSLKQDTEYLPEAIRHWTSKRYWRKLNHISQTLLSCSEEGIPDLIALCEVENDSVLHDLTKRSLLRNAGYEYLMTSSPDERGIDVALVYSPFSFAPIHHHAIRVEPIEGMRPTRDILYVSGETASGDTLHVFVAHLPSKFGGERYSRPFREVATRKLCEAIDSVYAVNSEAQIIIAGDFNDGPESQTLKTIEEHRILNLTANASAPKDIGGTYRYQGEWDSIDHILSSHALYNKVDTAFVHSPLFLLEEEKLYGGYRPRRTYIGMRHQSGFSDHLPLVVRLNL